MWWLLAMADNLVLRPWDPPRPPMMSTYYFAPTALWSILAPPCMPLSRLEAGRGLPPRHAVVIAGGDRELAGDDALTGWWMPSTPPTQCTASSFLSLFFDVAVMCRADL